MTCEEYKHFTDMLPNMEILKGEQDHQSARRYSEPEYEEIKSIHAYDILDFNLKPTSAILNHYDNFLSAKRDTQSAK